MENNKLTTMPRISVSNRKLEQATNVGRAQVLVPWPADRLGGYGSRTFDGSPVSPAATDRAMDRYIAEALAPLPAHLAVIGICAGRTARLEPVIVVTLANRGPEAL
jgi:hypothetical protein